jgi:very-short-patch-repair endonuclease
VRIEGYEVDLFWRDRNLIVEIDSWAFHSMRRSFEQDRRRDQRLTTAGWRVIRITDRQLTTEPERVVAILSRALALQR